MCNKHACGRLETQEVQHLAAAYMTACAPVLSSPVERGADASHLCADMKAPASKEVMLNLATV
jgi:hypothetical protein